MRTNVYVDGFNLFYGALRGTQFRWLDLEAFFDGLLPRNQVQTIHYFTGRGGQERGEGFGRQPRGAAGR